MNRRHFLKLCLSGIAAGAAPSLAVALLSDEKEDKSELRYTDPKNQKSYVTQHCGNHPAGTYMMSYFYKRDEDKEWQQHIETIVLEEFMPLVIKIEIVEKITITCMHIEQVSSGKNLAAESSVISDGNQLGYHYGFNNPDSYIEFFGASGEISFDEPPLGQMIFRKII